MRQRDEHYHMYGIERVAHVLHDFVFAAGFAVIEHYRYERKYGKSLLGYLDRATEKRHVEDASAYHHPVYVNKRRRLRYPPAPSVCRSRNSRRT